jgi:hypothetical protein
MPGPDFTQDRRLSGGQLSLAYQPGFLNYWRSPECLLRVSDDSMYARWSVCWSIALTIPTKGWVEGDPKDPASLDRTGANVDVLVSTVTSTTSRGEWDTAESVDRDGQL